MPSTPPALAPRPANSAPPSTLSVTDSLAKTVVLPSDDLSAYQRHCKEFLDQYLPKNKMEVQLTQTIADLTWRLNRISAIEADLFTMGVDPENNQDTADMSLVFRQQGQVMANLSMYERRLSVRFKETLNQLREIQAERVAQEASEMFDAANILQMHKKNGIPYNPVEDGFVFQRLISKLTSVVGTAKNKPI